MFCYNIEIKKRNTMSDKLKSIDHKKIPLFSFKDKVIIARVVDVYDGDTFTALFEYNGEIMKYKCRAMGYDCAEMKPRKDDPNRDQEKALALKAKKRFIELMGGEDTMIQMKCLEFDKYGRILTYVYPLHGDIQNDESINNAMIHEGHGKAYSGGTKEEW
jgi:endonuclease YncB( thermonuclease family)